MRRQSVYSFAIFLATGIGFYFEYDANKKFDLLNAVGEETSVMVIRNERCMRFLRKILCSRRCSDIEWVMRFRQTGVLLKQYHCR